MNRLPDEAMIYIKLRLYLCTQGTIEIRNWLFPTGPILVFLPKGIPCPSKPAPCICSRCGNLLGECIGGHIATICFACDNKPIEASFDSVVDMLQKEAYPVDITYELAFVLKEIFHGNHSILQCVGYDAGQRALYYAQDDRGSY